MDLKKRGWEDVTGFIWIWIRTMVGFYEHGNEPSDFMHGKAYKILFENLKGQNHFGDLDLKRRTVPVYMEI
jgi:hypothetical protein